MATWPTKAQPITSRPLELPKPDQNLTISTEILPARQRIHHLWLLGTPEILLPFLEPHSKVDSTKVAKRLRFSQCISEKPTAIPTRVTMGPNPRIGHKIANSIRVP